MLATASVQDVQWSEAEPILRKTYALMETSGRTTGQAVMEAMRLSEDDARRGLDALCRGGYIGVEQFTANGLPFFIEPAEKGLQYCTAWPTPNGTAEFISRFLDAIEARANDEAVPTEERGRLKQFGSTAAELGKGVLVEVASRVIEHQAGI